MGAKLGALSSNYVSFRILLLPGLAVVRAEAPEVAEAAALRPEAAAAVAADPSRDPAADRRRSAVDRIRGAGPPREGHPAEAGHSAPAGEVSQFVCDQSCLDYHLAFHPKFKE